MLHVGYFFQHRPLSDEVTTEDLLKRYESVLPHLDKESHSVFQQMNRIFQMHDKHDKCIYKKIKAPHMVEFFGSPTSPFQHLAMKSEWKKHLERYFK